MESVKTQNEKRRYPRKKFLSRVDIKKQSEDFRCVARDISQLGFGIISDKKLDLGECVIRIQDKKMKGRIVYSIDQGPGIVLSSSHIYHYGIELDKPIDELTQTLMLNRMGKY